MNGSTALALSGHRELRALVSLTTTGRTVQRIDIVLNPDKLPPRRNLRACWSVTNLAGLPSFRGNLNS